MNARRGRNRLYLRPAAFGEAEALLSRHAARAHVHRLGVVAGGVGVGMA